MEVNDIKGMYTAKSIFVESVNKEAKSIIIRGLMLPKGKISRNKVMYEWESIKTHHSELINKPVMYNHQIEGKIPPAGRYTDSVCLEGCPDKKSKWYEVWIKTAEANNNKEVPGWYYEADLNPDNEYTKSVIRGDLRHVSIQLFSDKAIEKEDAQGGHYTLAWVKNILEGSLVPVPGFIETTIELALTEAFNKQRTEKFENAYAVDDAVTTVVIGERLKIADGKIMKQNFDGSYDIELEDGELLQNVKGTDALLIRNEIEQEQMTTTTAGGAIAPALLMKKKKKEILQYIDTLTEEEAGVLLKNV